jgi:hypothetical protein
MALPTYSMEDLRRFRKALAGDPEAIRWVKGLSRREAEAVLRDHNKRTTHTAATDVSDHNHTDAANDGGGMAGGLVDDFLEFTEAAAAATPGTGLVRVYAKADGKLYIKDDAGTETDLTAGGITVKEVDGTPSVSSVTTIRVSNGDLTDDTGGQVTIDTTGGGGGGTTWLDHAASGNGAGASLDDEFDDSSKAVAWTETAVSGSATWTEDADVLSVIFNSQTASDAAFIAKTLTSFTTGDYIETAIRLGGAASNWIMGGLILTDGTGSSANQVSVGFQIGSPALVARGGTVTSMDAGSTGWSRTTDTQAHPMLWWHLRLTYVSANTWKAEASIDGVTWTDFGNGNFSHTMTPTHGGVWVSSWGGTTTGRLASFEYFRTSVT